MQEGGEPSVMNAMNLLDIMGALIALNCKQRVLVLERNTTLAIAFNCKVVAGMNCLQLLYSC